MRALPENLVSSRARGRRGGVLITALIFSAIIAVIALPSYLALSRDTLRVSHRGFYNIAVVDLAETGLEHALWAVNSGDWSGWDTVSEAGNARRKFTGFDYSGGVTGEVAVRVSGYSGQGASAVAKATITLAGGETLEKWAKVTMKGRSLFEFGLLAREPFSAGGGNVFDSWISDPDGNPATPSVPYSSAVARSNGSIATVSTAKPAIELFGSAKVYGKVAVGATSDKSIVHGPLGGASTSWSPSSVNSWAGLKQHWGSTVGRIGDPSEYLREGHLVTGFSATFEAVTSPGGVTDHRSSYVLSYNDPKKNNAYINAETLGEAGKTKVFQMDKLTVKADGKLTITGDVTLILPTSGQNTFEILAGGSLALANGATLKIYTPGNIEVSGAGKAAIVNNNATDAVQIWSTRPAGSTGQKITLAGSGSLRGVIYAPEAHLSIPGGTHFYGAAVVRSITMAGSGSVHYDESLKNASFGGSGSTGVESYSELDTPEERAPYAGLFDF